MNSQAEEETATADSLLSRLPETLPLSNRQRTATYRQMWRELPAPSVLHSTIQVQKETLGHCPLKEC